MKSKHEKLCQILHICVTVFWGMLLTGCATMHLPDYVHSDPNGYQYHAFRNHIVVGASPFVDKKECKKYFGTDLMKTSVVPIALSVWNQHPHNSYLLLKDNIIISNQRMDVHSSVKQVRSHQHRGGESTMKAGAVGLLVAPVVGAAVILAGGKMISDAEVIQHNLEVKEICNKTLSPDSETGGFVYFRIPETQALGDKLYLKVDLVDVQNDDTVTFNFEMEI